MSNQYQTAVTTGKVRLSYCNIFQPREDMSGKKKYSVTLLIPKTDTATLQKINDAIQAATQKGMDGAWGGAMPPQLPIPLHDGDGVKENGEAYGDECKGHWVFTASSPETKPVEVVGPDKAPILAATQIYSGIYANIYVNFFPYNFQGKKGIGCGLGPVQKIADGEPLGGSAPSAKSVFKAVQAQPTPAAGGVNPLTGQPM